MDMGFNTELPPSRWRDGQEECMQHKACMDVVVLLSLVAFVCPIPWEVCYQNMRQDNICLSILVFHGLCGRFTATFTISKGMIAVVHTVICQQDDHLQ